ncbi:MAG: acetyl-CoA C-acetyltransferase [Fibrobacterota bacterium]
MNDVVIAGYLRTAFSRSRPNEPAKDWFHKLRADELLAKLLLPLIQQGGLKPEAVDDFIVGSAMGVGEQWTMGGRLPLLLANLPETITTKFIDHQCGSSLSAIQIGFMEIATGSAETVIAAGMEHMTRVPMGADNGIKINEHLFQDARYKHWDMDTGNNMGLTAEKLMAQSGFTREDMEKWALRSHQRAAQAQVDGFFDDEILPVAAEQTDGSILQVKKDQSVRSNTTLAALADLKPAYRETGNITAGTSSPLTAGAAAVLLMSRSTAMKNNIKPLATLRAFGVAGVQPALMGSGPVPASRKALQRAGLNVQDIDYWEINEAFSAVVLYCIKELGIDPEKINVRGGALAIGHALGASGARITGTLARILNMRHGRYGVATACIGGGQGIAVVIEREKQ